VYLHQAPHYATLTQSILADDGQKKSCMVPKSTTVKYAYSAGDPPKLNVRVIGGACNQFWVKILDESILTDHREAPESTSKKP
jgi:hypothetical protein